MVKGLKLISFCLMYCFCSTLWAASLSLNEYQSTEALEEDRTFLACRPDENAFTTYVSLPKNVKRLDFVYTLDEKRNWVGGYVSTANDSTYAWDRSRLVRTVISRSSLNMVRLYLDDLLGINPRSWKCKITNRASVERWIASAPPRPKNKI